MPADATATRDKLITAGELMFATRGVEAAQLRDIVRAAGQSNDSAIHYHFGSRDGLLVAICERHIAAMEPERRRLLDDLHEHGADGDIEAIVAALVVPTVGKLHSQDGRYFLRIMAQLAGRVGLSDGGTPAAVLGTALFEELSLLRAACAELMPQQLADERIEAMISLFTAAMAERASKIDRRKRLALDQQTFTDNLISMWTAALRAPVPGGYPRSARSTGRRRTTSRSVS